MADATEQEENKSEEASSSKGVASLVAGLLGGVTSTVLLYPLDLVKVRLQVNEEPRRRRTKGSSLNAAGSNHRPPSALRVLRGVVRHEGLSGLYQGLVPAMMGSSISWGGYFFFYDGIKREMIKHKKQHHKVVVLGPMENFSAACAAGAIMVLFTNPLWLIKTRMQLQMTQTAKTMKNSKAPYANLWDAARTIVREEGPLALYKGSVPALMLVSHGGVQFVAYEFLRHEFHISVNQNTASMQRQKHLSITERFRMSLGYLTIGALSKIIATTATYPIQVVKSRLQQRSESLELTSSGSVRVVKREYSGVINCVQRIWLKEGVFGFFKGCIPNAIRVAPGSAVTFVVYESVMDALS